MTAAANLGLGILVVFVFAVDRRRRSGHRGFGFLARVLGVVVFATALVVLLSVLYVRYRDVQPIWEVALQLMFWGTPIIYTIESVPEDFQELIMMNPLAVLIQQGRTGWCRRARTAPHKRSASRRCC